MRTLVFDANSIILLIKAGRILEISSETSCVTTGIAAYELGNAVWKDHHLFKTLSASEARVLLAVYHETILRMKVEPQHTLEERLEILENAVKQGISYYDSSYLTAAIHLEAELVTEDKGLKQVAEECGLQAISSSKLSVR